MEFYNLSDRMRNLNNLQYKEGHELSFWLSEMDVLPPKEILDTTNDLFYSGLGYSLVDNLFGSSIKFWFSKYFRTKLSDYTIAYSPGVLFTIRAVLNILEIRDEDLVVLTPTFGEYSKVLNINKVQKVDMKKDWLEELRYLDFKTVLICNPNNPSGKIFTLDELNQLISICFSKNAWVISDEVYMDFCFGADFTPLSKLGYERIISLHSIGKTFNISGIIGSYFISNDECMVEAVKGYIDSHGLSNPNAIYIALTRSLYSSSTHDWLEEIMRLIYSNYRILIDSIDNCYQPSILEGTYCVTVNYEKLGKSEKELKDYLLENGMKVMFSNKFIQKSSSLFFRFNLACSPEKLIRGIAILNNFSREK